MRKKGLSYGITILFVMFFAITLGNNYVLGAESRTLVVDGSTTVFPIASAASDFYMDANPDDTITVTGTGSGTGGSFSVPQSQLVNTIAIKIMTINVFKNFCFIMYFFLFIVDY